MATLIIIHGDSLGRGDEELGRKLMVSYLRQLTIVSPKPEAMVFYNAGVKLLVATSPVLDAMRALDESGVELMACGTCVNYFGLQHEIAVGRVTDMREIVSTMAASDKVLTV